MHATGEPTRQRKRQHRDFENDSELNEERLRAHFWQVSVDDALLAEADLGENSSVRIDHRRDAGIGSAGDRQALFDGADLSLMKMLVGAGARSEPGIVGDVEQPARPRRFLGDLVGEDDLIADQRACRRRARDRKKPRTSPDAEAAAHPGELHDAETLEEVLKGEILAERDEMNLVVAANDAALIVNDEQAVIDAGSAKRALRVPLLDEPRRAREQRGPLR